MTPKVCVRSWKRNRHQRSTLGEDKEQREWYELKLEENQIWSVISVYEHYKMDIAANNGGHLWRAGQTLSILCLQHFYKAKTISATKRNLGESSFTNYVDLNHIYLNENHLDYASSIHDAIMSLTASLRGVDPSLCLKFSPLLFLVTGQQAKIDSRAIQGEVFCREQDIHTWAQQEVSSRIVSMCWFL